MPFCADIFYREYRENGSGFSYPVILIHGAGSDLFGWPVPIRRLPGRHIIALDLPGHGQSEGPVHHSLSALRTHLHRFILELGFAHTILVGYSLGGLIALDYAGHFPEDIKGLSLIAFGTRSRLPEGLMDRLGHPREAEQVKDEFNRIFFHQEFPHSMRQKIMKPFHAVKPGILKADFSIGLNYQLEANQQNISCPVQFISGSQDQIATPSSVRQLAYMFPGADLHFIPSAGHMVLFEKTDQVISLLSGFLAAITAP